MKKIFVMLAIAGFLAACNNDSESTTTTDSSSTTTNKTETQIADSIRLADTMNKKDSLRK